MLPNFLVIGAPRSGTTWISRNLMMHPEVFIPRAKELHFFDRQYEKGLDWYQTFFEDRTVETSVGEATPAYLIRAQIAERIRHDLGDIKLIASLRNPVDRVYSRYWQSRGIHAEIADMSFEERIKDNERLIEEGYYFDHLSRYFELFSRENILVLLYDDLKQDAEGFIRRIYEFLEVDPDFKPETLTHRVNAASTMPLNARSKLLHFVHKGFRRIGFNSLSNRLDNANSAAVPEMDASTRRYLETVYAEPNARLAELLDLDLSSWTSSPAKTAEEANAAN